MIGGLERDLLQKRKHAVSYSFNSQQYISIKGHSLPLGLSYLDIREQFTLEAVRLLQYTTRVHQDRLASVESNRDIPALYKSIPPAPSEDQKSFEKRDSRYLCLEKHLKRSPKHLIC